MNFKVLIILAFNLLAMINAQSGSPNTTTCFICDDFVSENPKCMDQSYVNDEADCSVFGENYKYCSVS